MNWVSELNVAKPYKLTGTEPFIQIQLRYPVSGNVAKPKKRLCKDAVRPVTVQRRKDSNAPISDEM